MQSYLASAVNPEPQLGPVRKLVPGPASQVAVQPTGSLRANPHGPARPPLPRTLISRASRSTSLRSGSSQQQRIPASSDTRMPVDSKTAMIAESPRLSNEFPRQHRPTFENSTQLPRTPLPPQRRSHSFTHICPVRRPKATRNGTFTRAENYRQIFKTIRLTALMQVRGLRSQAERAPRPRLERGLTA
jgi:hypothetical protein